MKKFLLVVGFLSVSGLYGMEQKALVIAKKQLSKDQLDALNKELLHAASMGNTSKVIDLLDRGAYINCGDDTRELLGSSGYELIYKNRTPLLLASQNGHLDTVKVLLEKKANVNAEDNCKNSALSRAIVAPKNKMQIIEMLIEHGADVDAKNSGGVTPLHCAALIQSKDMVEMIFLAELKKFKNHSKNYSTEAIIKHIKEQADRCCRATNKFGGTPYVCANNVELKKLLDPADTDGKRAEFISKAVKEKLAQESEGLSSSSSSNNSSNW